ncbi:MAG TPA: hypothetical protein GX713_04905 [Mollicutes bacterium]|nr:hypothetical protein [Mollicutes bacterium]
MRKKILSSFENWLKKSGNYNNVKIEEIIYGVEAIYVLVTRTILFLIINIFLGTLKEFFLFLFFYSIIRSFSYGFHAKSSFVCIILSSFGFVLVPYLSKFVVFSLEFKIFFLIISLISFILWSPADTENKPIVSKALRLKLKIASIIVLLLYSIIIIKFDSSLLLLILILQSIFISPIMYYLFNTKYRNYLSYGLNN